MQFYIVQDQDLNIKKDWLLVFLFLLTVQCFLLGQTKSKPFLLSWTERDGLSDNNVTKVIKDHKGYLWVGTQNGLNRFDGFDFEVFRNERNNPGSINFDIIRSLTLAPDSTIWIGSRGAGLSVFDYNNWVFNHIEQNQDNPDEGLSGNIVELIEKISDNELLIGHSGIGGDKGGFTLVSLDGKVKEHYFAEQLDKKGFKVQARKYVRDSKNPNHHWFGSRKFYLWDSALETLINFPHQSFNNDASVISAIVEISDSILLVGFYDFGIWSFNKETLEWGHQLSTNPTSSIKIDRHGVLWISDSKGIGKLNLEEYKIDYRLLLEGLESPFPRETTVVEIFPIDDLIWVATDKGLFCWTPIFQQFEIGTIINSSNQNTFYSVYFGNLEPNKWVFADRDRGLIVTDSTLNLVDEMRLPKDAELFRAKVFKLDGAKQILVSTRSGLSIWDDKGQIVYDFKTILPDSEHPNVLAKYIFINQETAFVGTVYNGLLIINLRTKEIKNYRHDPNNSKSLCHDHYLFEIDQDRAGNIWIVTDRGLSVFDPKTEEFLINPVVTELRDHLIIALEIDEQNVVWLGTKDDGLYRYDQEIQEIKHFTTKEGLATNGTSQLTEYKDKLWVTTSKALCYINLKTFEIECFDYSRWSFLKD